MTQNVPKTEYNRRIPVIIQGIIDGLSYEQIAQKCNPPVARRTIYRDRQSIPFKSFFNELVDNYLKDLNQLENGDTTEKRIAISHKGMLVRAMLKAITPTKIEAEITGKGIAPIVISFDKDTEIIYPKKEETDADDPAA